jgi:hypothetical protein
LASSITGTSITRAGGGGGTNAGGTGNSGGTGGGGNGQANTTGIVGTISTGSGGGGAMTNTGVGYAGGNGGSGIVIISYPTSEGLAASTTGSPTQTTVGSDYVYQWTGSGSITL